MFTVDDAFAVIEKMRASGYGSAPLFFLSNGNDAEVPVRNLLVTDEETGANEQPAQMRLLIMD